METPYTVTVAGELDPCWSGVLGSQVELRVEGGLTRLSLGPVDQGELLRLLSTLEEANIPILEVARREASGEGSGGAGGTV